MFISNLFRNIFSGDAGANATRTQQTSEKLRNVSAQSSTTKRMSTGHATMPSSRGLFGRAGSYVAGIFSRRQKSSPVPYGIAQILKR